MKVAGPLIKMNPKEQELKKVKLHIEMGKYPKGMTGKD